MGCKWLVVGIVTCIDLHFTCFSYGEIFSSLLIVVGHSLWFMCPILDWLFCMGDIVADRWCWGEGVCDAPLMMMHQGLLNVLLTMRWCIMPKTLRFEDRLSRLGVDVGH